MVNSFIYALKEGFKGVLRHMTMTVASVGSVAASLFMLGAVLIIVFNVNNVTLIAQEKFDKIQVFLKLDLNNEEIKNVEKQLNTLDGVEEIVFLSKEDAFNQFKRGWGKESYVLDGVENPMPHSFIVNLKNLEDADHVYKSLSKIEGIDEIKYYKDVIDKIMKISSFIKQLGLGLIVMLTLISLFTISNTIKLALYARRKEINIMKYVGATNWFIRRPFIVEGMVLGAIGSGIGYMLIMASYKTIYNKLLGDTYWIIGENMLSYDEISKSIVMIFFVMGIGIGILGSLISLRRHLRV